MGSVQTTGRKCHCFPVPCGAAPAHLSTMPNGNESAGWLEGTSATGQQVGPVVGLQHPHKVGTLHLGGGGGWEDDLGQVGVGRVDSSAPSGAFKICLKWPQNRHLGSSTRLSWGSGTGCWSWWGAVTPDITHRRISSLVNTLLPLSGLRWPQHLKHSLYDP